MTRKISLSTYPKRGGNGNSCESLSCRLDSHFCFLLGGRPVLRRPARKGKTSFQVIPDAGDPKQSSFMYEVSKRSSFLTFCFSLFLRRPRLSNSGEDSDDDLELNPPQASTSNEPKRTLPTRLVSMVHGSGDVVVLTLPTGHRENLFRLLKLAPIVMRRRHPFHVRNGGTCSD